MKEYSWAEKYDRNDMKVIIVTTIRSMDPPGRFLKRDTATDKWFDIVDKKAIVKVGQAFRHLISIYDDKSFVSKEDNNNNNNNNQMRMRRRRKRRMMFDDNNNNDDDPPSPISLPL
mmetsp:Transcript_47616/g.53074  ORF Transcript_47616/g.53074 Transcript_47616/m.53074 type:complete len:116 (+) Transcript_47616:622-969(+)